MQIVDSAIDDVRLDDPHEPSALAEKAVAAALALGYGAKVWDKAGDTRVYLTRGEGRKRQEIGYLIVRDGLSTAGLTRNAAGIRNALAAALQMEVR